MIKTNSLIKQNSGGNGHGEKRKNELQKEKEGRYT